jgi:PAS domain S-box-containing protein
MDYKGLQLLRNVATGVVMVDIAAPGVLPWIEEARNFGPEWTYLGVAGDSGLSSVAPGYFYDVIRSPFTSEQVGSLLDRSWERGQLLFELQTLRKKDNCPERSTPLNPSFSHRQKERVLRELSRVLNNNFDQERLLELFLDTVAELVPVGKLSIFLLHEGSGDYVVFAQRGLDPTYCSGLRFKPSQGLMSWLAVEGRILRVEEISGSAGISAGEAIQEMQLLQAVVSIPLMVHGQLVGALNLGPKITGASFHEDELETLYILSGNIALALRDIQLHHQLRYQKLYIESILQRMNSGVLAINRDDNITALNCRAREILALQSEEAMGKDLRCLPSPLGDLLYETLSTGKAYHKEEIELVRGRIPLEISTYQLVNEGQEILGSVMIFDDVSERKRFELGRRQADQLDVLNRFVGQLAHEIKNPMVAIQTFSELLPEKFNESAFRDFFTGTVRQEVKRLNELVEQLIAFSTPISYKYDIAEIHEILDLGLLLLQEQGKGSETPIDTSYCGEQLHVKADKTILSKAISYLLSSFRAVEEGGKLHVQTAYDKSSSECGSVVIRFWDSKTKAESIDVEKIFEPLYARHDYHISLGLPVSRKIFEDHGGCVEASSTKDKFLKFEIRLPIFSGEGGAEVDSTSPDIGSR